MKTFLNLLLAILGIGGWVCSIVFAIILKAWIPLIGVGVLGWMAYPSVKRLVNESL